jgi:UDP-glucose 4-epimerase
MKKVIITGGAGYIGSHTCKLLKKNNIDPIVIDNFSNGFKTFVKWGKYHKIDLKNFNDLNSIIKKTKPLGVIHFAGKISVDESKRKVYDYYENNFSTTLNLLECMRLNNVKKLIFSSSAAIYGETKKKFISEKEIKKPYNPYANSKLFSEKIIQDYIDNYNFNAIGLRYFNSCGADLEGEVGEAHDPETHVVPLLIDCIKKNKTFKIFGKNFKTEDGTAVRDYIHVTDLAQAHLNALKKILNTKSSYFINIGSGKGTSVLQLIKKTEKILKTKVKYKVLGRRGGDVPRLVANINFAKKILKWKPENSDIEKIILSAWNWHNKK